MSTGIPSFIPFVAITIGVAVGAEMDLLGFLTARYFGLQVYGRAYAWQYGLFILAAGASPVWIGAARDNDGIYMSALFACAGLSCIASLLFFLLPKYSKA